jgi:hypothetical protein
VGCDKPPPPPFLEEKWLDSQLFFCLRIKY